MTTSDTSPAPAASAAPASAPTSAPAHAPVPNPSPAPEPAPTPVPDPSRAPRGSRLPFRPRECTRRSAPRAVGPSFVIAVTLLGIVLAAVVIVPLLPFYDPMTQNLDLRRLRPFEDPAHLLGADPLGRDMLSRLVLAVRVSLLIAVPAVLLNLVIGVALGLPSGYFGGKVDNVVSAVGEIQMAVPVMLLLIALVSAVGPSITILILTIGVWNWTGYGRVARANAMKLRELEFVWAPRTQGASNVWVIRKHLLPNLLPQLAVLIPFDIGAVILMEAALSYVGLGVQAPMPTLGGMIQQGQPHLRTHPHLTLLPGLVLFAVVAGLQFLSQRYVERSASGGRR